jgi:hypothetical protein
MMMVGKFRRLGVNPLAPVTIIAEQLRTPIYLGTRRGMMTDIQTPPPAPLAAKSRTQRLAVIAHTLERSALELTILAAHVGITVRSDLPPRVPALTYQIRARQALSEAAGALLELTDLTTTAINGEALPTPPAARRP